MNKHFLNSKSNYIWRYVQSGLSEQHMIILAAIIRDLDRETARTETGKSNFFIKNTNCYVLQIKKNICLSSRNNFSIFRSCIGRTVQRVFSSLDQIYA